MKTFKFTIIFILLLKFSFLSAQEWKADYDTMRVRYNEGKVEIAAEWLENFIPKYEEAPDRDTAVFFEMIHFLGRCYLKQGFNNNAEMMFKEDIDFYINNPDHKNEKTYSASMIYLAYMYYNLRKFDESERMFKEVLKLKSDKKDLTKTQHIALLNNIAIIANTKRNFERADSLYTDVIRMKKEFYGDKSYELSKTLLTYAILYRKMGRYKEAETKFNEVLAIRNSTHTVNSVPYLQALYAKADLFKIQGKYEVLEKIYEEIAEITKNIFGSTSLEYAKSLSKRADLFRTLSKYKEAEPIALQVVQIIEDTIGQNNLKYTQALIDLASLYKSMTNYPMAEIYYKSALSIYEVIVGEYHESYVRGLVHLASLYRTIGRIHDAEPLYQKSMEIYQKSVGEQSDAFADLLNEYGLYLDEIGSYELAEESYVKCLKITEAKAGKINPNYAVTLDNLANLYIHTGHAEKAEPLLLEAAKIRKEVLGKNHPEYAVSLNNVANLFVTVGRIEQAKALYKEALEIIKEIHGTDNPYYANALDNIAAVYEAVGEYQQAEKYVKESLEINNRLFGKSHHYYTTGLNNLARLYLIQKNTAEAERLYLENLDQVKVEHGENHPEYATGLSSLADLYEYTEQYEKAEELYVKALKIRKEKLGVNHRLYTNTLTRLAGVYTVSQNFDKADKLWEESLNNYLNEIKLYFPSMSEKEKQAFYEIIKKEFELYYSYVLERYQSNPNVIANVYNYQLATKAIILNASNKVRKRILSSNDKELVEMYKLWLQQKELLSKVYSLSKEELEKEGINRDSIESYANQLEKKISNRSEFFKNSNDTLSYTWKDVQKKIKQGEAVVELIRFTKTNFKKSGQQTDTVIYFALIVDKNTKNNPEMVVLPNGNDLEKKYINYYRNVVKLKLNDKYTYSMFWKTIDQKISSDIKKLYLSPDGVYNQMNLNTLLNDSTGKYFFDEKEIQILSNSKDLCDNKKSKTLRGHKSIKLIGDPNFLVDSSIPYQNKSDFDTTKYTNIVTPLDGTAKEIHMIQNMFLNQRWTVKLYEDKYANESLVKEIQNPSVLHIATHGFFEKNVTKQNERIDKFNENPLFRSGLMFAGSAVTKYNNLNNIHDDYAIQNGYEDGKLSAYEAMNLSLDSTELVVLSACETGLGDVVNGEGVYGLQRSFLIAGAKSVVISLWKVDDNTTEKLMTYFYNEWLKDLSDKRGAFIKAQQLLKKEFPDPFYWGAFVMIGE